MECFSTSQSDRLSAVDETGFQMLSCNYVTLEGSDDKMIALSWDFKVFKDIVTIKSFRIQWESSLGGDPGRVIQGSSCKDYNIADPLLRCDFTIHV